MSRTLARLRSATGDPLLVRAGRGLVPTPRAAELRDQVHELTRDVRTVLSPHVVHLDAASLERTFTIRAGEGFMKLFSVSLVATVTRIAPCVRLRFAPKPDKDALPLRDGQIDLEIGVLVESSALEVRTRFIFRDDFIGAVRAGHPLLAGAVTPERYTACRHVVASRRGAFKGPVDDALQELGLRREIVVVVARLPGRNTHRAQHGPGCAGAAVVSRQRADGRCPARARPRRLRPSRPYAGDHDLGDVAPPHGRRPGTSLAARHRDGGVPRGSAARVKGLVAGTAGVGAVLIIFGRSALVESGSSLPVPLRQLIRHC